jgi:hypothetical protein
MKADIASANVGFRLTERELADLKRFADARRWSLSQSVRIIVRQFLEKEKA